MVKNKMKIAMDKKDYSFHPKQNSQIDCINNLHDNDVYEYLLNNSNNDINFFWLGRRDYDYMWNLQKNIQNNIKNGKMNDVILFLEHDPIYTIGRNTDSSNILPTKPLEMPVVKTDRGGDVTYHGPGQLVGYPIVDLKKYRRSITWFMRGIEESIIRMLYSIDIVSTTKEGLTGVWVQDKKIAALGVRLSRWVSMHGFAINIYTNMTHFNGIIPCGISDFGLTSIHKLKSKEYSLVEIASRMSITLSNFFEKSRGVEVNHA